VDASAATVLSRIDITDKIDGASTVRLNTGSKATVVFAGKIDGASTVIVNAPDGHVVFNEEINGLSHIHVTAKSVVFHKKVDGGWNGGRERRTEIHLTLADGAVVSCPELCAHLHWKKQNPAGVAPRIELGKVHWDGKIIEVK
jgi:hypothetical protein